MQHIDFFSGAVSGFSFAASHVWPDCEHVALCEIDPWRQKQLQRLWPGVPIIKDINHEEAIAVHINPFNGDAARYGAGQIGRQLEEPAEVLGCRIDLATFSPPCQPASCAGLRLGTRDPRFLWPQALKALEITKPRWAIFENPDGLLSLNKGMVYESICADLEGKGYWVETFIIPASAVGAWHRRNRVWIVANLIGDRCDEIGTREFAASGESTLKHSGCQRCGETGRLRYGKSEERIGGEGEGIDAHPQRHEGRSEIPERRPERRTALAGNNPGTCADVECAGLEGHSGDGDGRNESGRLAQGQKRPIAESPWNMHWLQTVESLCSLVDHGESDNCGDFGEIEKERAKWIAALGDSVVVPLVIEIMKAIKESDRWKH